GNYSYVLPPSSLVWKSSDDSLLIIVSPRESPPVELKRDGQPVPATGRTLNDWLVAKYPDLRDLMPLDRGRFLPWKPLSDLLAGVQKGILLSVLVLGTGYLLMAAGGVVLAERLRARGLGPWRLTLAYAEFAAPATTL